MNLSISICFILQVDPSEWHGWDKEQREEHLKKFREATIQSARIQAEVVPQNTASATSTSQDQQNLPCTLAVSFRDAAIPGIPEATLSGIWSKAAAIVSKSSSIVNAPGSQDSKLVESKSGKRPHFVTKEKSGRFTCDDGCKMWLSIRICAHTVAVAHTMNLLLSFVDWRKKYKGTSVRLAGMVMSDTPKGAGKKGGKPKKKYSQSTGRNITVQNYASPFDDRPLSSPSSPFENAGFFLKWVSRRISVCQGKCQRPMRNEEGRIYPPPYDLCLARKERRSYKSPVDGTTKLGKEGDCHYHLKKSCVDKADPPFQGEIVIPPEVTVRLTQAHKDILRNEFGLKI